MEVDGPGRGVRPSAARASSPYLNTAQAAHYLGLSARTLETMRTHGGGPPYRRHGRRIRYHIQDLDAWSASHCHHAPGNSDSRQGELPFCDVVPARDKSRAEH